MLQEASSIILWKCTTTGFWIWLTLNSMEPATRPVKILLVSLTLEHQSSLAPAPLWIKWLLASDLESKNKSTAALSPSSLNSSSHSEVTSMCWKLKTTSCRSKRALKQSALLELWVLTFLHHWERHLSLVTASSKPSILTLMLKTQKLDSPEPFDHNQINNLITKIYLLIFHKVMCYFYFPSYYMCGM